MAPGADDVRGRAAPGRLAVLYDGSCEMCVASIAAIARFDNSEAIDALDLFDRKASEQFPDLKREDLVRELHVVDDRGRVFRGALAINEILRHQRGPKGWLAYAWHVPGFAWLADRQYRKIAATRHDRDTHGRLRPTSTTPR
jgi:predicted DCC family thiol-disulfide oxidoreductase YuxK